MRRPLVCLSVACAFWSLAASAIFGAPATKEKFAPVTPHYDPPDQPFRMAPMPQSTRSIVVPLATNLHLAFDTALLRTHTVWSGKGLALLGPQYGLPKSPFISTNDGTVLWTMPPVFPWAVGKLPEKDQFKVPNDWKFESITTHDGTDLSYGNKDFYVCETPIVHSSPVLGVMRHIGISRNKFGTAMPDLWFLAHAEMGRVELISASPPLALIERANDVLLVGLKDFPKGTSLEVLQRDVDYTVETVTEQAAEKGNPKHQVTGRQARVYVHSPPTAAGDNSVVFSVLSEIFPSRDAALQAEKSRNTIRPDRGAGREMPPPAKVLAGNPLAKSSLVSNESYRAEAFPLPPAANLQITGMAFLNRDQLAVCTWAGEVWVVENAAGPVGSAKYRRFARGLCEPMGIAVNKQSFVSDPLQTIYISTKQALYELSQKWGNGEAQQFECLNQSWGYTGGYNSFFYGPVFDKAGNFILANAGHSGRWDSAYMGWALRLSPDGKSLNGLKLDTICSGLREPNGIGTFGPDRDVFVTENQGQWMAACKLNHVTPGKFYGHPSAWPAPQEEYGKHTRFDPPAVWFPYKLARSVTGFAEITDDRFGPFKGQLMVGDFQNAIVTRVQLEKVNGEYQGAVWPFLKQFQSGVNRLVYGPDGKLYVGGLQAPVSWKAVAPLDFALERIEFTGKVPFEVKEVHALRDGFELTFTQPVEPKAAADPESYDVTQYGFKYHAKYGSPELDHDGKENAATVIKVAAATVSPDKLKVRLKLEGWKTGYVTMVRSLDVKNGAGESLVNDTFWYTLNQLPK